MSRSASAARSTAFSHTPGVRAVGDDLAVQIEAVAHAGRGVHQEAAFQGKGQLVGPGGKLADGDRVRQPVQGNCERLVDNSIQRPG